MINKSLIIVICSFAVFMLLNSCTKPQEYSEIPQIKFKKLVQKDTVDEFKQPAVYHNLYFSLIDGDGNIGLHNYETTGVFHKDSAHYKNFYLKMLKKQNGAFEEVNFLIPLNYRIPYIEPIGQNKSLKATLNIEMFTAKIQYNFDTVKYVFYLEDRAFNKSNIDSTIEIPRDSSGVFYP